MKNILFVGIDVDSKNYHVCILNKETGETFSFKQVADVALLLKKLRTYKKKGNEMRVCYEASFVGFSLCRALKSEGIHCDVIAPSAIPRLYCSRSSSSYAARGMPPSALSPAAPASSCAL